MMKNNREIERKFIISEGTDKDLNNQLMLYFAVVDAGTSRDIFYNAPNTDVCRYRENTSEFTIKVNDNGNITDRIEENIFIDPHSSKDALLRALEILFGPPTLVLTKCFSVFHCGLAIVSLYTVVEDSKNRYFLEVEGDSLDT